jgi:hypothetical protein
MLVDAYGSDSDDNNSGDEHTLSRQNKSTSLTIPAPSHSSPSGSSNLTLPAPRVKKAPKKIAIDLPALPKDNSADNDNEDARPAKKARTDSRGAGSSGLFSKLPAPKLPAPVKAAPERILGSGKGPGLSFNSTPLQKTQDTSRVSSNVDSQDSFDVIEKEQLTSLPFTPAQVRKGKANISLEDSSFEKVLDPSPPVIADLFSLSVSHPFLIHLRRQTFSPQILRSLLPPL